jgi:hypothetical protein
MALCLRSFPAPFVIEEFALNSRTARIQFFYVRLFDGLF